MWGWVSALWLLGNGIIGAAMAAKGSQATTSTSRITSNSNNNHLATHDPTRWQQQPTTHHQTSNDRKASPATFHIRVKKSTTTFVVVETDAAYQTNPHILQQQTQRQKQNREVEDVLVIIKKKHSLEDARHSKISRTHSAAPPNHYSPVLPKEMQKHAFQNIFDKRRPAPIPQRKPHPQHNPLPHRDKGRVEHSHTSFSSPSLCHDEEEEESSSPSPSPQYPPPKTGKPVVALSDGAVATFKYTKRSKRDKRMSSDSRYKGRRYDHRFKVFPSDSNNQGNMYRRRRKRTDAEEQQFIKGHRRSPKNVFLWHRRLSSKDSKDNRDSEDTRKKKKNEHQKMDKTPFPTCAPNRFPSRPTRVPVPRPSPSPTTSTPNVVPPSISPLPPLPPSFFTSSPTTAPARTTIEPSRTTPTEPPNRPNTVPPTVAPQSPTFPPAPLAAPSTAPSPTSPTTTAPEPPTAPPVLTQPPTPSITLPPVPLEEPSTAPTPAPQTPTAPEPPTAPPVPEQPPTPSPTPELSIPPEIDSPTMQPASDSPTTEAPSATPSLSGIVSVTLSPFNVVYTLDEVAGTPLDTQMQRAGRITKTYIDTVFTGIYEASDDIVLVSIQTTAGPFTPSPIPTIGFLSVVLQFDEEASTVIPTQSELDSLIFSFFQPPAVEALLVALQNVPPEDPFSTTSATTYERITNLNAVSPPLSLVAAFPVSFVTVLFVLLLCLWMYLWRYEKEAHDRRGHDDHDIKLRIPFIKTSQKGHGESAGKFGDSQLSKENGASASWFASVSAQRKRQFYEDWNSEDCSKTVERHNSSLSSSRGNGRMAALGSNATTAPLLVLP